MTRVSLFPKRQPMARSHLVLPFIAAAAGIGMFSVMDAAMKGASVAAGVFTALFLRVVIGSALMLPIWLKAGNGMPAPAVLKLHLLRSAVVALMAPLFFWGLVRMPLAEAIALSFIAPLIALYLAAVLLGEQIGRMAIAASLVGFGGVLVIVAARLGQAEFTNEAGWGIAAVLTSAVFYAWNLVLQRQQAQLAGPAEVAMFQNLFVAAFLTPVAPWLLHWPAPEALGAIALAAMLAIVSLMALSWAYARAEAQVLVPIEYTGFGWAALFGWLWFAEPVTWTTVAGVALIVAACWIAARGPGLQTAL